MVQIASRINAGLAWLSLHRARLHRFGLVVALSLFIGGLILAISAVPDVLQRLTYFPLLILLAVCMPLQVAFSTAEFKLLTRYGGQMIDWWSAFRISVYAGAANMLPLPGGFLTRVAAMKTYGITLQMGSYLNLLGVAIWGGTAFLYAGIWLAFENQNLIGAGFVIVGLMLIIPTAIGLLMIRSSLALLGKSILVRIGSILVEASRMTLAVYGLGEAVGFENASIFVIASFLGAIVAFAPTGLGVREAVVAALSPLAGIDPAVGFIAATVNRAVGLLGLAMFSGMLLALTRLTKAKGN